MAGPGANTKARISNAAAKYWWDGFMTMRFSAEFTWHSQAATAAPWLYLAVEPAGAL
jgi:hypothetical protein